MALKCVKCGKDITRKMKKYFRTDAYCTDCYEIVYNRFRRPSNFRVKTMYASGDSPSEIAEKTGYSVKHVYEILNKK